MEQAIELALCSDILGRKLLDDATLQILNDVHILNSKKQRLKNELDEAQNAKYSFETNVSHTRKMVSSIEELSYVHRKTYEQEMKNQKDISSACTGYQRNEHIQETENIKQQEHIDMLEEKLSSSYKALEEYKTELELDSDLLKELMDHLNNQEDLSLLLLQHSAGDNSEIKSITLLLERLSTEVAKAEINLRETRRETYAIRTVRNQLVSAFLKEADNRDDLLNKWEATLDELQKKGKEEVAILEDIYLSQIQIHALQNDQTKEENLLIQIQGSIEHVKQLLRISEIENSKHSMEFFAIMEALEEIQGQNQQLRTYEKNTEKNIKLLSTRMGIIQHLICEKESLYANLQNKCRRQEKNILLESEVIVSSEDNLNRLNAMKNTEEKQLAQLEFQIEKLQKIQQKDIQKISETNNDIKCINGEIEALKSLSIRCKNEIRNIKKLQDECHKLFYIQESELVTLKSRIRTLEQNERNNDMTIEEKSTLHILNKRKQEIQQAIQFLKGSLQLLETRRIVEKLGAKTGEEKVMEMKNDIRVLMQECDGYDKELVKQKKCREEFQVDCSLSQLNLQNMINRLASFKNTISSASAERLQMEQLMKEEQNDIRKSIAATKIQIRSLDERKQSLTKKLHAMSSGNQQLQEKYHRIRLLIDVPPNEHEEITPIRVMVKIAQEKEGLQGAGDALDNEVKKAENELQALQEVYQLINFEGDKFRSNLHQFTKHNQDDQENINIKTKIYVTENDIKANKNLLYERTNMLQTRKDQLREIQLQVHAVEELLGEKIIHAKAADEEIRSQRIKAKHMHQAIRTVLNKIKGKSLQLRDVDLKVLQSRIQMVNSVLCDLVTAQPDIYEACLLYCQHENVPPPKIHMLYKTRDYRSRSSLGSIMSSKGSDYEGSNQSVSNINRVTSVGSVGSVDSGSSSIISTNKNNHSYSTNFITPQFGSNRGSAKAGKQKKK